MVSLSNHGAQGIANYALAVMYSVKAFAHYGSTSL